MPLVSVVMAVYNGECWLSESIESILKQSLTDFEFIIVNDGSFDSTIDVIKHYMDNDSRIRLINKSNTGLADSLNVGVNQALGKWIARIDADDISEPHRLRLQYSFAESNKDLVLLGSGHCMIDEFGNRKKVYTYPSSHEHLVNNLIQLKGFFPHSSAFIKRESLQKIGGYRSRIKRAEDYDLWLRISDIGKISCLNDTLVRIRYHVNQISNDNFGRRQLIDSHAAVVSYILRNKVCIDPVSTQFSDIEYSYFLEFVEQFLIDNELFEYRNFIKSIKAKLQNDVDSSFYSILKIVSSSPGFLLRYFYEFLISNKIGFNIAHKWLEISRHE